MFRKLLKALTTMLLQPCARLWGRRSRGSIVNLTFTDGTITGFIDYVEGYIQVTKTATANIALMKNGVQAENVARTTAVTLARKQIVESLRDLIDSKMLIEKEQDEFKYLLRGSVVVSDKVEWVPDKMHPGAEIPLATATVRLFIPIKR